jgi:hypothetical protein
MRQSAQRKYQVVETARLFEKREDEIAGAHIVSQIAELFAAVGIVTQILNDRAAIGVPVRFLQLLGWASGYLESNAGLSFVSQSASTSASCDRTEYAPQSAASAMQMQPTISIRRP